MSCGNIPVLPKIPAISLEGVLVSWSPLALTAKFLFPFCLSLCYDHGPKHGTLGLRV